MDSYLSINNFFDMSTYGSYNIQIWRETVFFNRALCFVDRLE